MRAYSCVARPAAVVACGDTTDNATTVVPTPTTIARYGLDRPTVSTPSRRLQRRPPTTAVEVSIGVPRPRFVHRRVGIAGGRLYESSGPRQSTLRESMQYRWRVAQHLDRRKYFAKGSRRRRSLIFSRGKSTPPSSIS